MVANSRKTGKFLYWVEDRRFGGPIKTSEISKGIAFLEENSKILQMIYESDGKEVLLEKNEFIRAIKMENGLLLVETWFSSYELTT